MAPSTNAANPAAEKETKTTTKTDPLKAEFDSFKKETRETNNKILGVLEMLINKDKDARESMMNKPVEEIKIPVGEEIVELSPRQREIFEKYFDPRDGFTAVYNLNENVFSIKVPMSISNTSPAYREFYKEDIRSRKVDQNNILGSIDSWCRLVCQNLNYNRKISLK